MTVFCIYIVLRECIYFCFGNYAFQLDLFCCDVLLVLFESYVFFLFKYNYMMG